ncbi:formimidoylglutamate deiminase [Qipengyuania qiaonensis]|uniref:Formimidoylglutamate deiminase n=1 Tax=Qipengyuania qiaonensis TaxID=2867240 RepID=A0ABS7J624_9SPHN|nr:formimidoylglutamate deiminase [Qipengyuania qiaonensis]MBX7482771.1 formimidoylglutamate deiminase [Qipengyuania qiaonensis]
MAGIISARQVLTPSGWLADHAIHVDDGGTIAEVSPRGFDAAAAVGTALPGMANVHTHSFQRAMAGLAEARGPEGSDDFWTWRKVMYRFLDILAPHHIEAIAAQVQLEMAEAGYTASAEFHYLHHTFGGGKFDDPAEMSNAIFAASEASGIGLTHLPVLYTYGGLDKRPLAGGQLRFGNSIDEFETLHAAIASNIRNLPADFRLGAAPHSLRAVDREGLEACLALCPDGPIHIHAAEQVKEVEEVEAHLRARPVRWLLDNMPVDHRWCLIHATHLEMGEVADLASSQAVAGLCPTTEANLGDGIFAAREYLSAGGRFGIGSDSNIRLSVAEELRMLEVSQRLKHRQRAVLTDNATRSNGRYLYERAAEGGAQAIGRQAGAIAPGQLADIVALRDDLPFLDWPQPDQRLDAWIFGVEGPAVSNVWSAGRHIVRNGEHIRAADIRARFASTIRELGAAL